jgi:hypothetical protein
MVENKIRWKNHKKGAQLSLATRKNIIFALIMPCGEIPHRQPP